MEWTYRVLSLGCYVNRLVPFSFPFEKEKTPKESGKVFLFLNNFISSWKVLHIHCESIEKGSFKSNYS